MNAQGTGPPRSSNPSCSHSNPPHYRFCDVCGARLPVQCPRCRAVNRSQAAFCRHCGFDLRGSAGMTSVPPIVPSSAPEEIFPPTESASLAAEFRASQAARQAGHETGLGQDDSATASGLRTELPATEGQKQAVVESEEASPRARRPRPRERTGLEQLDEQDEDARAERRRRVRAWLWVMTAAITGLLVAFLWPISTVNERERPARVQTGTGTRDETSPQSVPPQPNEPGRSVIAPTQGGPGAEPHVSGEGRPRRGATGVEWIEPPPVPPATAAAKRATSDPTVDATIRQTQGQGSAPPPAPDRRRPHAGPPPRRRRVDVRRAGRTSFL